MTPAVEKEERTLILSIENQWDYSQLEGGIEEGGAIKKFPLSKFLFLICSIMVQV